MTAVPHSWETFNAIFDRKERVNVCLPSPSPLETYGEAVLCAFTRLLDSQTLIPQTWIAQNGTLNPIWMPLQGVCWFFCCRQGFSLLGRDYGEKEEEESFELRNKEDLTPNGRVKKKKKRKNLHLHHFAWVLFKNAWHKFTECHLNTISSYKNCFVCFAHCVGLCKVCNSRLV